MLPDFILHYTDAETHRNPGRGDRKYNKVSMFLRVKPANSLNLLGCFKFSHRLSVNASENRRKREKKKKQRRSRRRRRRRRSRRVRHIDMRLPNSFTASYKRSSSFPRGEIAIN